MGTAANLGLTELSNLFPDLTEAEKRLWAALPKGLTAFCGVSEPEDRTTYEKANDPKGASSWPADRTVRADLLRWICVNRVQTPWVDPRGISLCAARITGRLDLSFVTIPFPLSFDRCVFDENVECSYVRVPELRFSRSRLMSLTADGAVIAGGFFLDEGFMSVGGVRMMTAQIGGNLEANGGSFEKSNGYALQADRAKIAGSAFLGRFLNEGSPWNQTAFRALGGAYFVGAQIGNVLNCAAGSFEPYHAPTAAVGLPVPEREPIDHALALVCNRLKVGTVLLNGGFSATGGVRLWGAEIATNLDCNQGHFKNLNGSAISANGAHIGGNICLQETDATGVVDLLNCQVGGDVDCGGGTFTKLSLVRANVKGSLNWSGIKRPQQTQLDLTDAMTGPLQDEQQSWPSKGNLVLAGFRYSSFSSNAPQDVENRLHWLTLPTQFSLQPYQQLAKVLKDSGDAEASPRILFEMEHRRRQNQDNGRLRKATSLILRWTIGYGQMPLRALWWLLGLITLGAIFYSLGYLGGIIAPSDKDAFAAFEQQGYPPAGCPQFNPIIYSVEHSFPLVNLELKDHWQVGTPPVPAVVHSEVSLVARMLELGISSPLLLRSWMWLQTLSGWVLATLFVAGLSGVVKSG